MTHTFFSANTTVHQANVPVIYSYTATRISSKREFLRINDSSTWIPESDGESLVGDAIDSASVVGDKVVGEEIDLHSGQGFAQDAVVTLWWCT